MYQVEYGSFPQLMTSTDGNVTYCPTPADTKYCIKPTSGNTYAYSSTTPYQNFIMDTTNTNSATKYRITNDSVPVSSISTDTVIIGTQTWMKYNLDVGSMITGATNQTNNSVVEKYCYDNDPVNCTIYGGLYQWDEAMQYVITPGTQGICPSSFHIPTDNEYKTLEMYLGMTQIQADDTQERGDNQGTQLKIGGTSGFDGLFGGSRWSDATFKYMNIHYGYFWTSSEYDLINPWSWYRIINSNPQIIRIDTGVQSFGFSVRCLKN